MFRPMTSVVSTLSGFVANGHRAMHHVSSSPSEIPYGGFSPVRLQAGCRPRPSSPALTRRQLIRGYQSTHPLPSLVPSGQSPHSVGAAKTVCRTLRPRGPWLGVGLYCPVASSLTMATSEPLTLSGRLILLISAAGLCLSAKCQRVPNLSCVSLDPCRLPYPGGPGGHDCCSSTCGSLRPLWKGSASAKFHLNRYMWLGFRGCRVRFMLRPGSLLALHRQGRLLSSFQPMSRLAGSSNMTTRQTVQLPRPDLHRQDTQPYRLQPLLPGIAQLRRH